MLRFFVLATCFGIVASSKLLSCFVNRDAEFRPGLGKFEPENFHPKSKCTHLILGYAQIYPQVGTIEGIYGFENPRDFDYYKRFNALKLIKPDMKTMLSIGGPQTESWLFINMLKDNSLRWSFAAEIVCTVKRLGFDGVDIAWFYPSASDKAIFANFLMDLHNAASWMSNEIGSVTISATVSGHPHVIENHYDPIAIVDNVDFINVQSFDYHGKDKTTTGHNSPLYAPENDTNSTLNVDYALNLWHKLGMPKNKILMGVPSYGRTWYLTTNNTEVGASALPAAPFPSSHVEGIASQYDICRLIWNPDPLFSPPWINMAEKPRFLLNGTFWYSYDDENSVVTKTDYILENGFGGGFINSLDWDDFHGNCTIADKPYPILGAMGFFLNREPEYQPTEKPTPPPPTPKPEPDSPCEGPYTSYKMFFADPSDCKKYIYCMDNTYHLSCPEGLYFSQHGTQGCNYYDFNDCPDKPTGPPLPPWMQNMTQIGH